MTEVVDRLSERDKSPTIHDSKKKSSVAMDPAFSISEHKVASGVGIYSSASGPLCIS